MSRALPKFETFTLKILMDPIFCIYIGLALFIAWIWVDYFRLIDIFEKENIFRVGFIFLMGASSVFLVLGIHEIWPEPFGLYLNGHFFNDLSFCTFSIGLIEETAKTIPVIIALLLFRKHINEPVDYIATFSVSALGFAAAENVMYFSSYGAELISSRAVLSNIGHMMFASLTAYGIVLVRFRGIKPGILIAPALLLAAALFHGFYDLGLLAENAGWSGTIMTLLFFFFGVSVFATILNNSLNISPFFSYKHVIHSSLVTRRLFVYYGILFALQFLLVGVMKDTATASGLVVGQALIISPIVIITIIRLSRFKLIHNRWNLVIPELPFGISFKRPDNQPGFFIGVKGNPYSDYAVNRHFESYLFLCPMNDQSQFLRRPRTAYIFRKLYINGDMAHYAARVFVDDQMQQTQTVLLQMKRGASAMWGGQPVVALLYAENADTLDTTKSPVSVSFIEWATIRPAPSTPEVNLN